VMQLTNNNTPMPVSHTGSTRLSKQYFSCKELFAHNLLS